jgi:hypothetical protein
MQGVVPLLAVNSSEELSSRMRHITEYTWWLIIIDFTVGDIFLGLLRSRNFLYTSVRFWNVTNLWLLETLNWGLRLFKEMEQNNKQA